MGYGAARKRYGLLDRTRAAAVIAARTFAALAIWLTLGAAAGVQAGGGPENVLLVVNSRSWASMSLANHYQRLRQIPPHNVIFLDWSPPATSTTVARFRERILGPVLATMEQRGLGDQIDYIVYSSDFPTAIDLREDIGDQQLPEALKPIGSLTGMTYLAPLVLAGNVNYMALDANRYFRDAPGQPKPTHGFRSWYGWGENGELLEAGGQHYLLSSMLGVTSGRGNSVREAISGLHRSAAADGSHPGGTVYYVQNSNVRSQARHDRFPEAVAALEALGVKAEVAEGTLPRRADDVMGAMIGTASFRWEQAGSTILPGAICDNFTSYGGVFTETASQTPLSEFLRHGAAGSSGTVVEPFAIAAKFPSPWVHVHYARGATLAEAFHQSVAGPYQLLLVGDSLCRPWADIPTVSVEGIEAGQTVRGTVSLRPQAKTPSGATVDRYELFVNGVRLARGAEGDALLLNTTIIPDGRHELRIVAIEPSTIESQGRLILPIVVDNHGGVCELTITETSTVEWGKPIELRARSPGAVSISVFHASRELGVVEGEEGVLSVDPKLFGYGPVVLTAVARNETPGAAGHVVSEPLEIDVRPGPFLPGRALRAGTRVEPGLLLRRADGETQAITDMSRGRWFQMTGVKPKEAYAISGVFEVPSDDVYQFQVRHVGPLRIEVDQQVIYDADQPRPEQQYLPVVLGAGMHSVQMRGTAGETVFLDLRFGGQGVFRADGRSFQHARES